MAVKGLFAITAYDPQTDNTWRCLLHIWSGVNSAVNVANDEFYAPGALAATVNASLHTFVEGYIQSQWGVEFNPLLDVVKMLNPVSLV